MKLPPCSLHLQMVLSLPGAPHKHVIVLQAKIFRGLLQMHRCFMVFYQWFHFKRQPQTTKRWPARRCNSGLISWSIQWQSLQKKTVNYLIKHPVLFCALHHFNDAPCFGSILTYHHEMIWNGWRCVDHGQQNERGSTCHEGNGKSLPQFKRQIHKVFHSIGHAAQVSLCLTVILSEWLADSQN